MVANGQSSLHVILPLRSITFPEKLINGVVLDLVGIPANLLAHPRTQRLVPPEIALDVDPMGAFDLRLPHRLADLHSKCLHRIISGDDASPLVTKHADREACEPGTPHGLRGSVERV